MMAPVAEVAQHLFSRLNESRVKNEHCDISVHVGDQSFRCHRLVLGAMSEYFRTMFSNINFIESHAEHITLHEDIHASTFAKVLDFMYNGEIILTDEDVVNLLVASDYFGLPFVEEACIKHLERMNYIPDAIDLLIFSRTLKKESLRSVITLNIFSNFRTISRDIKLLELPFADYYELLDEYTRSGSRGVNNMLNMIERWISHARHDRLKYFQQLVDIIGHPYFKTCTQYFQYVEKKLLVAGASSSFEDSEVYASRSASSLHVFLGFEDDLVDVFSWAHSDNNWHHSCTVSDCNYGFRKRNPDSSWKGSYSAHRIKHAASSNGNLYCLMMNETGQQKFCTASSIDFKQDFKALKPPPVFFYDYDLCASRNGIYSCGSKISFANIAGFIYEHFGNDIFVYKPELDSWLPVASPEIKVCDMMCAISNDLVYVIGNDYDSFGTPWGYLQAYDSRASQWQKLGALHFECYNAAACCIHKGKIYVNGAEKTNVFDPVAGKWQPGANNIYAGRSHHRLISYRDCVWAIGGDDEFCDGLIMEVYDTINDEWCVVEALDDFVTKSIRLNRTCHSKYPKTILDAIVFDPQ